MTGELAGSVTGSLLAVLRAAAATEAIAGGLAVLALAALVAAVFTLGRLRATCVVVYTMLAIVTAGIIWMRGHPAVGPAPPASAATGGGPGPNSLDPAWR